MPLVSFCPEKFLGRPHPAPAATCVTPLLSACRCPEYGNDSILNRLVVRHFACHFKFGIEVANVFEGTKPKTHQIRLVLNCRHVDIAPSKRKLFRQEQGHVPPACMHSLP